MIKKNVNQPFAYKKVLTILLIIIVLFLAIFLPIYFLVIKKSSSSSSSSLPIVSPLVQIPTITYPEESCITHMITFPEQINNLIENNMIKISLESILAKPFSTSIVNNTSAKPCYVSWFKVNDSNSSNGSNYIKPSNDQKHFIKTIETKDNFIVITFEETTLNGINPFPLQIYSIINCVNNINSCDFRNQVYK